MKYLLVFAIVFAAIWLWRSNRQAPRDDTVQPGRRNVAMPQDMIACAFCDLHVPRTDALPGPGGLLYCSAEHRRRAGD